METIRVNMTPCEDVQTIHASQNDNEAREWEFELHNNGEKIDSSSISDQMVFKAYEGGTEEILPTNGSVPSTAPIIADIQYPQGELTDQSFTYRQSPTEEDGLAKITDIKGNTLVWNQLIQNGNFADGLTDWVQSGATLSVSNGVCRATFTGSAWNNDIRQSATIIKGHKYLLSFDYLTSADLGELNFTSFGDITAFDFRINSSTTKKHYSAIQTAINNLTGLIRFTMRSNMSSFSGQYYEVSNVNLFDLTQMGLDITSPSEFTSLFPLPYYAYNQGTLLSFMGNGIKTTGKNFVNVDLELLKVRNSLGTWNGNEYTYQGVTFKVNLTSEGYIDSVVVNGTATANANLNLMRLLRPSTFFNKPITMSGCPSGGSSSKYRMTLQMQTSPYTTVGHDYGNGLNATIPDNGEDYQAIIRIISGYTCDNLVFKPIITFQGVDQTFEPYTESISPLTIQQYFPNGMKSAGNVYDELTETKAITRIGAVNMGTLSWTRNANYEFFYATLTDGAIFTGAEDKDLLCPIYTTETTVNSTSLMSNVNDKTIRGRRGITSCQIYIKDTSYTSATDLVNALQGIPLYYELATPTETPFTTASLVTEKAEIPLSNNDGTLIGKCTEQLSAEPGFHDAKIKLADEDGECYSNKLQLHVERSPQ